MTSIALSEVVLRHANRRVAEMFAINGSPLDLSLPPGEPAIYPATSLSWRVYKNPVSMFIGSISAVYMQLSEPRVRTGVWENTSFRADPLARFKRTGAAAMMTMYGPRSRARAMLARVDRIHDRIQGVTRCGQAYRANDPELMSWVFNTLNHCNLVAYQRFGAAVSGQALDQELRLIRRVRSANSRMSHVPQSMGALSSYIEGMLDKLEPSRALGEFTSIMTTVPLLSRRLMPLQRVLVRAAISNIPQRVRDRVGLGPALGLRPGEASVVRAMGAIAERVRLDAHPAFQACRRLGLDADRLFGRHTESIPLFPLERLSA